MKQYNQEILLHIAAFLCVYVSVFFLFLFFFCLFLQYGCLFVCNHATYTCVYINKSVHASK